MQVCSNCGAASREGAKFCTTCGSRLNPVTDPDAPSGWDTPQTEDRTPVAAVVNVAEPEAVQDEQSVEPTGDAEEEEADSALTGTAWSWDQAPTTDVTPDEPVTADANGTVDADAAVTSSNGEDDDSESLSSWASQWSDSNSVDAAADTNSDDDDRNLDDDHEQDADRAEAIPAADPSANSADTRDASDDNGAAPFMILDVAAGDAGDNPPAASLRDRAYTLLDELRDLFDTAVQDEAETVPAGGEGTDEALATLMAIPADDGRFDNLRAILEKAREHPRDVDTMLDLLGEINTLIALIDSHETYVSAVQTAVSQLRPDA